MQEVVHIILTSLGSIVVLFFLTKITGDRQISQLSMFDYINSITIGSIAAEMATALEGSVVKPLTAMIVYGLATLALTFATSKSIKLRRFFTGKAIILMDGGKIYRKNLAKAKIDLNEFLALCRNNGYFDLSAIQTVLMEANGKFSILPTSSQRQVTPQDLNLNPPQEKLVTNVIIDGKVLDANLKSTGNDRVWLEQQIQAQGVSNVSDVFLATVSSKNQLTIYVKIEQAMTRDPFE